MAKKTLKQIFLKEALGDSEEQKGRKELEVFTKNAEDFLKKGTVDEKSPTGEAIQAFIDRARDMGTPAEESSLSETNRFGTEREDPFGDAFDEYVTDEEEDEDAVNKAYAKHELTQQIDEPGRPLEECGCSEPDGETVIPMDSYSEPMDAVEFVQLSFPEDKESEDEDSSETNNSFRPASPLKRS